MPNPSQTSVPRRVALFRGVNVGGHNPVPMAALRETLSGAGFGSVDTYIQSGNVLFESQLDDDDARDAIRSLVATHFTVDTPVLIRSAIDLSAAISGHPWEIGEYDEKFHHVLFLAEPAPDDAVARLVDRAEHEDIAVVNGDLHVRYRNGVGRSKLTIDVIDRRLDTVATGRNLRTVRKLADLAE